MDNTTLGIIVLVLVTLDVSNAAFIVHSKSWAVERSFVSLQRRRRTAGIMNMKPEFEGASDNIQDDVRALWHHSIVTLMDARRIFFHLAMSGWQALELTCIFYVKYELSIIVFPSPSVSTNEPIQPINAGYFSKSSM